jgi:DNA-binding MarR family transcriptional regulator
MLHRFHALNTRVHDLNIDLDVHTMNTVDRTLRGVAWRTSARRGENERVVLGRLESVEQDGARSQRRLAADLGIAVGLVNAYLNRCVRKGLVKVTQAPARRYAYYLTPQGFVEKSRLSLEYLTYSFKFFRQAKLDCLNTFEAARERGIARVALDGISDIAEIATICARETDVEIVAIVDRKTNLDRFAGIPIARTYDAVADLIDGLIVTDLGATQATIEAALARFGVERVLVPSLLQKATGNAEAAS